MYPEDVLRRSQSNFSIAFWGLGQEQKRALAAVYAFCRVIDDAVDEAPDQVTANKQLVLLESQFKQCAQSSEVLFVELDWCMQTFGVKASDLRWLMEGAKQDVSPKIYDSWDELLAYCDAVASSVGYMCMDIFKQSVQVPSDYVIATGRALQLTNIARDVFQDSAMGRIYIPQTHWSAYGLVAEDFFKQRWSKAFETMLRDFLQVAASYYQSSGQHRKVLEPRKIWPAEVMKGVYYQIYKAIAKRPAMIVDGEVKVAAWKKLLISRVQYLRSFM